jgi:hypothetical protein
MKDEVVNMINEDGCKIRVAIEYGSCMCCAPNCREDVVRIYRGDDKRVGIQFNTYATQTDFILSLINGDYRVEQDE